MAISVSYMSKKKARKQSRILIMLTWNQDILRGCDANILSVNDPQFIHDVYDFCIISDINHSGLKLTIDPTGKHVNLAVDKEGTPVLSGSELKFMCHISGMED